MSEWISVEDRLPLLHQRVITWTLDVDGSHTAWFAHWNGDKTGFLTIGGHKDKDISHWMPLPEPPK